MFRVLNYPPLPALGVTLIELMLSYRQTLGNVNSNRIHVRECPLCGTGGRINYN